MLLLNVSLTFHDIWPTPAVTWRGEISIELGAYLCLLALLAGGTLAMLVRDQPGGLPFASALA